MTSTLTTMKRLLPLLLTAIVILTSGCTIQPWVKPYERAALADEVMSGDRHPSVDDYMDHVHEVREGSRGASGTAGGGCGCN
ncbi:MAG: DUF4266 domain-containing protein [Steroidobacter sp.]